MNDERLPEGRSVVTKLDAKIVLSFPSQWLDRSWISSEQYEEEILSLSTLEKNLVALISSVNVDLNNVDAATLDINHYCPGKFLPGDSFSAVLYSLFLCCLGFYYLW